MTATLERDAESRARECAEIASRRGRSEDERDEFRQDALVRCFLLMARTPDAGDPLLQEAAHRAVASRLRREILRRHLTLTDGLCDRASCRPHDGIETRILLDSLIARLPDLDARIVRARLGEAGYGEIASALSMPEATVRSRHARAVARMSAMLRPRPESPRAGSPRTRAVRVRRAA